MKTAFIGAALLLGLAGVVLSIPVVKSVERSAVVPAPPAAVHAVLHDLRTWNGWLPARERVVESSTYEGDDGAVWRWKMKDGRGFGLKRTSSTPSRIEVEMLEGAAATQTLTLVPEGAATKVTWRHDVTLTGLPKLAPLWRSPEEVIGPILEENLAALGKRVAP